MDASAGIAHPQARIVVRPASALAARRRLFEALGRAFPVSFVGTDDADVPGQVLSLFFELGGRSHERKAPSLHFADGRRSDRPTVVRLAQGDVLARPLAGAVMTETGGIAGTVPLTDGAQVLATIDEGPIWVRRVDEDRAALAPEELADGESLRDAFRDGRFIALLPLVHRLRELAPELWPAPPLRATYVFDDPNLHWTTYGFIRFANLARHASEYGYRATMAYIPRDMWAVHRRAAAYFREDDGPFGLAVHGNDHLKRELAQELPPEARRAILAQALRRTAAAERRHGIRVARVMVPPHGATARETALEIPRLGFEAMTDSKPIPWLTQAPPEEPLAGWMPVDLVEGGLPVIPRYHLTRSRDDLPFRAFLGQPLILYGHHDDLASGLDVLALATSDVNSLGDVRWLSLGEIARTNAAIRRKGSRLEVKLLSSVVEIDIPAGVEELVVHAPGLGPLTTVRVEIGSSSASPEFADGRSEVVPVSVGGAQLRAIRSDALDPMLISPPRVRLWPLIRRAGSEARDRALPAMRRLRNH